MRGGTVVPRPLAFPLFLAQLLLLQAALLGSGGLTTAVALAATATVAATLAACALLAARRVPTVPPTRVRTAIRDRARRTAFLPQRDPDAPGRRRPRAPGHTGPATTAA
ncbi:DUF6412 domain-containing protein [Streptomyces achromogenes]|uniref:DUF6412 domain-containing protein n=1 Tax=Streptomyces achromogenes TaxID=67255 RepID=UPI0033F4CD49